MEIRAPCSRRAGAHRMSRKVTEDEIELEVQKPWSA
jgi:hypothetical protein